MKVKIYNPAKTTTQSGQGNIKLWIVRQIEESNSKSIDSIMGWTSSSNTQTQLKLKFQNKEDAISYAQSQNFEYEVIEPKIPKVVVKSYESNFLKKNN